MTVVQLHELADQIVDATAAGRLAGIGRQTVLDYIRRGELEATRLGQHWAIRRSDVDALATRVKEEKRANTAEKTGRQAALEASLAYLAEHPGAVVAELSEALGASRRASLGYLQVLEYRGLVERCPQRRPDHPYRCYLTEAGAVAHRDGLPEEPAWGRGATSSERRR